MILDIVVDVQKDFITGALANPQAQANVAHLAESVKAHARAGHWLFLTRDTHPDNYLATREGRHLPVEHCIEGERTAGTLRLSWRTRWTVPSPRSATSSTSPPSAAICCRARSSTS